MKKIILVLSLTGMCAFANYYEYHYTRKDCTVIDVSNNMATILDSCGYEWNYNFDYNNQFIVGDKVHLKMDKNLTDEIKDDTIVKVIKVD